MPCASRQTLPAASIAGADVPLQLGQRTERGRVQRMVARLRTDIRAGRLEMSGNAERRSLRVPLEAEMRSVDLADAREAQQPFAQERSRALCGRAIDATDADIQREV